jgi:hypothetical protein
MNPLKKKIFKDTSILVEKLKILKMLIKANKRLKTLREKASSSGMM